MLRRRDGGGIVGAEVDVHHPFGAAGELPLVAHGGHLLYQAAAILHLILFQFPSSQLYLNHVTKSIKLLD